MRHTAAEGLGRASGKLKATLRKRILAARLAGEEYLPAIRELCAAYDVSLDTVRRAINSLVAEGLIVAEPRRGYRIVQAPAAEADLPVAYVLSLSPGATGWDQFHQLLQNCFQVVAAQRGWPLLALSAERGRHEAVLQQLRATRSFGVILDSFDRELIDALSSIDLPVVMADSWDEHAEVDAVIQDNYRGGYLAAEHLIRSGHRELAWFGPVEESSMSRERFGGACAALAMAGLPAPKLCPNLPLGAEEPQAEDKARYFLTMMHNPTAVLALWAPLAVGLETAARKRRLEFGRDIHVVTWSPVEAFEGRMPAAEIPSKPAITWSVMEMARAALARLAERRNTPGLPAVRVSVPTRLVTKP